MKVLKLCTSDELAGDIPDASRAYRVAERVIRERTGMEVETVLQNIWPTPRLPRLLEGWVSQHEPDVVLFVISPYWMTFESVPLRVRRSAGPIGEKLGAWMTRVGEDPRLSPSWPVRLARGASLRLIRGAYPFEPEEVASVVEDSLGTLLTNESLEVVVRGPLVALGHHGSRRSLARAEARRRKTDDLLKAACARLHVAYVGRPEGATHETDREHFTGDFVHTDAEKHRERGELEGAAIAEVWLRVHGMGGQR
jgi:hypothetical protein